MPGPLAGIRVLELAQWWFVPAAGAVLADWGADVLKVEHPVRGDAQRGLAAAGFGMSIAGVDFMMQQSNRGKKSIGLDVGVAEGRALLLRLAAESDVFLTNFLPSARRKLGIEVEDLRAANPRIVYVRGSGHGPLGPDADRGGYDATAFWSRGGVGAALTPPQAPAPTMQRAAFGDSIGAMTIAGGVAAALLQRERSGVAPVVDVSLLGTALWVMAPDVVASKLLERGDGGGGIPSFGRGAAPNPLANSYRTQDGRWLLLMMLQPDRYWAGFCEAIERPDLAADPRYADGRARFESREALIADLDATFASRPLPHWRARLDRQEGPWAPMQTARELHDDPQTHANGYVRPVDGGDKGVFDLVASPVQFDGARPALAASPEMGQNTEEVLLERGLDWDALAALKRVGAIL
ncbi:MAG: formyl-CoA transferase [Proteobacteria bacterium]|nr:MAG: formyl-CoA transferase [Pseudomonadota bacterium]